MSRKKNPAALIAGIAAAVIGVSIIAVAVLAVTGRPGGCRTAACGKDTR